MGTTKNTIGFQHKASGSNTFQTYDPVADQKLPETFYEATAQEVDEAVHLASQAFQTYSQSSGRSRAAFLRAIAQEMLEMGDGLLDQYVKESGLPRGRAEGERGRTVNQLRLFADLVETDDWRISHKESKKEGAPDLRKLQLPMGPVAVFGASNFPLAFSTAGGDTASALAAGCPVLVKSHPMHAGTGALVAQAITRAAQQTAMPEGVFSNLLSSGIEVGQQLVKHPGVKAIGFTGSHKAGRALYDLAAGRREPIPVFAEMGSVNPVLLSPRSLGARAQEIAEALAGSVTLGAGQFCTNPGIIMGIVGKEWDQFLTQLQTALQQKEAQCMLHPNIKKQFVKEEEKMLGQSTVRAQIERSIKSEGNTILPQLAVVQGSEFISNPALQEEVFGPFTLAVACQNEEELLIAIEHLQGQLTGSLYAESDELGALKSWSLALQKRVGRMIFNEVPTGVDVSAGMHHGGPYPASTDARFTAVGTHAIYRWVRPVCFQNYPEELLPEPLKA
ncbi:aldehyde dehydrogenase (NADP(+)) [Croceiramulus getboli]|nr:aldehyde dehydrogenase (NADP(+)) [Flavobacteriaceae bacterium YJPT1-3]